MCKLWGGQSRSFYYQSPHNTVIIIVNIVIDILRLVTCILLEIHEQVLVYML